VLDAQQINRVIEAFAKGYFEYRWIRTIRIMLCRLTILLFCSPGPLANPDAAYVLSYSVIMLNTVTRPVYPFRRLREMNEVQWGSLCCAG
jgi:hypothetical protein